MKRPEGSNWAAKPVLFLIILYVCAVLARFLLALVTSAYPTILIDEFLYYSLARSIATEGKLLFHGQPANYAYILYPLVLSPVYLFFRSGANYFRLIQLWNIMVMSAAIFPAFGLCHAMLKDDKKALRVTFVVALLPDFILAQLIFSEVVIYPLFFTTLYCAYRYIDSQDSKCLLFIGLIGALLYYAKPGAMLPSAVFLLLFLAQSAREKNARQAAFSIGGIAVFGAVFAGFKLLLKYAFGFDGGTLSIYETQVSGQYGWHLDVFFKAIPAYFYYFILSCGIIGFAYPFAVCARWRKKDRFFALCTLVCLIAMIVGTAWTINRHEYASKTIHLRYIAMYIPLALLFCFVPQATDERGHAEKAQKRTFALIPTLILACVAVSAIIFAFTADAGNASCYPFMSLSVLLLPNALSQSLRPLVAILVVLCCGAAFALMRNRKMGDALGRVCAAVMALFMLVNGIQDYASMRGKTDFTAVGEVSEAKALLGDGDYLYVYTDERALDSGLDVNGRSNTSFITMNDLFNHLYPESGRLVPFTPEESRGMIPAYPFPDVDTVVFDKTVFPLLKTGDDVTTQLGSDADRFLIARLAEGKPMVSSILGNVKNNMLEKGDTGILVIYDDDLLNQPLTMRFDIQSDTAQTLSLFSGTETKTIPLSQGRAWCEADFERAEAAYNFITDGGDIRIYHYEIVPRQAP